MTTIWLSRWQDRLNRIFRQVDNETVRRKFMVDYAQRQDEAQPAAETPNDLTGSTL